MVDSFPHATAGQASSGSHAPNLQGGAAQEILRARLPAVPSARAFLAEIGGLACGEAKQGVQSADSENESHFY